MKRDASIVENEYAIMIKAKLSKDDILMIIKTLEGQYANSAATTDAYNCTVLMSAPSRLGTLLTIACQFASSIPPEQSSQFVHDLVSFSMTMSTSSSFTSLPKYTVEKNHVMSVILPHNATMVDNTKRTVEPQVEINVPYDIDRLDQRTTNYDSMFGFYGTGINTSIYFTDTGVETTHSEFNQNGIPRAFLLANTIDNQNVDCNGHGTHVSGLAAGYFFGVAKDATVQMTKTMDCTGNGDVGTVVAGLMAIDAHASVHNANNIFVISMSINGPPSTTLASTLQDILTAHHVIIVVAAGNSNADACAFGPSGVPGMFTVGASDMNDKRADFSNFGSCVMFYAPGVSVTSAWLNNLFALLSGTSMSTPLVAGAAAVIIEQVQRNYTLGPTSGALLVKQILLAQASRPSTLDKPLLFTFFDATSANNYGIPIPPPPGPVPTPAPRPPTSPTPKGPTPPPFSAPNLQPAAEPNPPGSPLVEETASANFISFSSSYLGVLWMTTIWAVMLRIAN